MATKTCVCIALLMWTVLPAHGTSGPVQAEVACPPSCRCLQQSGQDTLTVDCSNAKLRSTPTNIPLETTDLLLSNNNIKKLEPGTFRNLQHLQLLDLSRNKLSVLPNGTFDGLSSLQSLSLANNGLASRLAFPDGVFQTTPGLEALYIQGNCNNGRCSYPDKALRFLHNLTVLYLDGVANKPLGQGFRRLHKLEAVHIFGEVHALTKETFVALEELRISSLDVSECVVNTIEPFTFSRLNHLTNLSLHDNSQLCENGLHNLTQGLNTTRIKTLCLSYICNTIPMVLQTDTLSGLSGTSLEILDLSDNRIRCIEPVILGLPQSLTRLSLRQNRISNALFLLDIVLLSELKWFDGSFQNVFKMDDSSGKAPPGKHQGHITFNQDSLPDIVGTETTVSLGRAQQAASQKICTPQSFNHVLPWRTNYSRNSNYSLGVWPLPPKLEVLLMSNLKLGYYVPKLQFSASNSLKYFNVSSNELLGIRGGLYGLHSLEVLDYSYNRLSDMHPDSFCDLPNLKRLYLQGNHIGETISSVMSCRLFARLPTLQDLDLGNNGIKRLQPCLFSNLSSLKRLRLDNNSMTVLDFDVSGLVSLELLDLSDNLIQYVAADSAEQLSQIAVGRRSVTLCLAGNQNLLCSCDQQRFLHWMVVTTVHIPNHELSCKFRNNSKVSLKHPKLVYEHLKEECISFTVLTCCIFGFFLLLVLLAAIAAVYSQRWKLRYLYYVGKRTVNPYHPIEETTIELTFDAYISYDQIFELPDGRSMHQFVTNTVYPALKARGHSVRIRDELESGKLLHDVISGAIRQSDRVVVFLTSHYCSDFWNTFEFNMAAYEGIYTKRAVIIPVIFGAVDASDLTPEILAFVRAKPVLRYNSSNPHEAYERSFVDFLERQISHRNRNTVDYGTIG